MTKKLPHPVIRKLKAWRTAQGFSQSEATRLLIESGVPVALATLQQWEIARSEPRPLMVATLEKFLGAQERLSAARRRKTISPVIERLKAWRQANNLSQSEAVEVLLAAGLPVKLRTLQDWETARRSPRPLSASALDRFLDEHPAITHPSAQRIPVPQSSARRSSDNG
jgi:transcriptional regulator with XRE-family HTH domain